MRFRPACGLIIFGAEIGFFLTVFTGLRLSRLAFVTFLAWWRRCFALLTRMIWAYTRAAVAVAASVSPAAS